MVELREKIVALAGSVAEEYGFEVADVEIGGSLRKPLVRVFIDKPGGVTLDDCERMSRALSARLDVEEPIRGPYTLEVSSPGLDRPLKRTRDFERSIGKRARVITRDQIERQNFFVGKIVEVRDEVVRLALDQEREVLIPIAQISKARLEIEIK